jgi:hypothetical protein
MTTTAPNFMGPTVRSPLTRLSVALRRFFALRGVQAGVYLGLRYRDLWDTSRVVLIDGEFDGSNAPKVRGAGEFVAPWHKASVNPRELVGWLRPVTLSIRAVDPANIDSEDAQIEATEFLIEATLQGLHNAMWVDPVTGAATALGQNNIEWGGSKGAWCDPGTATQQTFGKEFLIGFQYKCVFYDLAEFDQIATVGQLKGPMLSNLQGGVNASIASVASAAQTAVIAGLAFCNPSQVGLSITLSGAAQGGNNGTFPIAYFLSPESLVIANAGAVAPDANSGAIAWQIGPL